MADTPEARELALVHPRLQQLLAKPHSPVLVEVCDVLIVLLRGEREQDPASVISRLEQTATMCDASYLDMAWQQFNFYATGPLSATQQRLYLIKVIDNDSVFPSYRLTDC